MVEFWSGGSKLPAVTQLRTLTLEWKRSQFCPLILEVVKQSMTWRGKREPRTRAEVDQLNKLLAHNCPDWKNRKIRFGFGPPLPSPPSPQHSITPRRLS